MKRHLLFCFYFLFATRCCYAQDITYGERLGYPKGARVLILHVDDVGAIEAMTKGVATSCSVSL